MVLQLDAAPNEVRLPGGLYSPTVDAASDADLERNLGRRCSAPTFLLNP
jgi:hypothetical protein